VFLLPLLASSTDSQDVFTQLGERADRVVNTFERIAAVGVAARRAVLDPLDAGWQIVVQLIGNLRLDFEILFVMDKREFPLEPQAHVVVHRQDDGPAIPMAFDELKTGGDGTNVWFAWMDANYPEQALHDWEQLRFPHPLVFVLQQLGFDWELGTDECLCLTHYDSKSGAEDLFLEAVAPFVQAGSYLEWRGEDGSMWLQEFDGKSMSTKEGKTVYE